MRHHVDGSIIVRYFPTPTFRQALYKGSGLVLFSLNYVYRVFNEHGFDPMLNINNNVQ